MENEKKSVTPWFLLEIAAEFLDPTDFQAYCDTHPEEVRAAQEHLLKDPYIPQDQKASTQ